MPKSRNPKIEFDRLQLYFSEPYVIDVESAVGKITVFQPTIGDVVKIGERRFYKTLSLFITNTTSHRLMLWEAGKDWNIVSDFELFTMLIPNAEKEVCRLFLGDLDLSKFKRVGKNVNNEIVLVLYDEEDDIEINEEVYWHLSQYLREVFNIFPEEKITSSGVLKKWYIDKDKRAREREEEKNKNGVSDNKSSILPVISAYLNHPGTKYKSRELKEVGVCEFWDGVNRLQIYEQATACMKGLYSGMVDSKSVTPDSYNFMKEINRDAVIKDAESYKNNEKKSHNKKK